MAKNTTDQGSHQGSVKDPEHDGRLKENREAGRTKGTTEASHARAEGHPKEEKGADSHATSGGAKSSNTAKANAGKDSGSDEAADLKAREYKDADGNIHHHTKTYMEQHKND